MTSAENNVWEPPNLKMFWGRILPDPPTRLVSSALAIMPPPPPPLPLQKTGPGVLTKARYKKGRLMTF